MEYRSSTSRSSCWKTEFYDKKIKPKFVVNDGYNKKYILNSIAAKWRIAKSRLFRKFYKWDLTLEENLRNYPRSIDPDDWAAFVQYRRKQETMEMARKNAANRAKLRMNHSLGTKSLARKRDELEIRDVRKYNRGEMFAVSHKSSDGSFVNEEAKKKNDQLQAEIAKTHLENEAFVKVFGKEHGGFARSKGLGVTPSQLTTTRSTRLTCSSEDNEKMKKMQDEIDSLREKASQVDILKEQVAFLMQVHNSKAN
ncbi:Asparagine-rich protein (ARP protein) [Trifolium repens]|nr:Asparagine-rich protein (ARP protein) [Trifolium repens]